MTRSDAKDYAQEMLRLNPHAYARQIVERRARHLGIAKPASEAVPSLLPRRRQEAEMALAEIRSDFWNATSTQIKSRLAALDLAGLPDLAATVTRLSRSAELRPEFEQLHANRKIDKPFLGALQLILVAAPAAAGELKRQTERALRGGRKLRSAKRTVQLIGKEYPQIYAMEREWLDYVASVRRFANPRVRNDGKPKDASLPPIVWVIIVVALTLLRALLNL